MKQSKFPLCEQPIGKRRIATFVELDALTAAVYAPEADGDLPSDIGKVLAGINDPVLAAHISDKLMRVQESGLGTDNIEDAEFFTRGRFESASDYSARIFNRLSELREQENEEE